MRRRAFKLQQNSGRSGTQKSSKLLVSLIIRLYNTPQAIGSSEIFPTVPDSFPDPYSFWVQPCPAPADRKIQNGLQRKLLAISGGPQVPV